MCCSNVSWNESTFVLVCNFVILMHGCAPISYTPTLEFVMVRVDVKVYFIENISTMKDMVNMRIWK